MAENPETSTNKAKADKLWGDYGRLQAKREGVRNNYDEITERMRQIQQEIQKIER